MMPQKAKIRLKGRRSCTVGLLARLRAVCIENLTFLVLTFLLNDTDQLFYLESQGASGEAFKMSGVLGNRVEMEREEDVGRS